MKKVICVFLIVFLCGCSGGTKFVPQIKNIKFTAMVTFFNEYYEAQTEVSNDGTIQILVTQPSEISGLKFTCFGEDVTAEYMGLKYKPDFEGMPNGVAKTLCSVINDANESFAEFEESNGNYEMRGRVDDRAYTLLLSPSGLPISVEIPDDSYKIDFKNVTLISN